MTLLSEVIAELNDRFGLGLGTSDEILVYQQGEAQSRFGWS